MIPLPYALRMVYREPGRYLPAGLAVAFSAVLVSVQAGMLLGFLESSSRPISRIPADLWVGSRDLEALGYSHPVEQWWYGRVASQPEVERVEPYVYGVSMWHRSDGGLEQCYFVGTQLDDDSVGLLQDLRPQQRCRLAEPGGVALYDPDRKLLGLGSGVGAVGEINGTRVEVVAILSGPIKSAGLLPGLVCSLRTARRLLPSLEPQQASYLVARCRRPGDAAVVVQRLAARYPDMGVYTREQMIARTKNYWLTRTRAGLVLAFSAVLGLLVGAVVTTQTFYSIVTASWRELAVLRALGIPRRHMIGMIVTQGLATAVGGLAVAVPLTVGISKAGESFNVQAKTPPELLAAVSAVVAVVALLAALAALRSLRVVEPAALLR